jgi:hypothetical protein
MSTSLARQTALFFAAAALVCPVLGVFADTDPAPEPGGSIPPTGEKLSDGYHNDLTEQKPRNDAFSCDGAPPPKINTPEDGPEMQPAWDAWNKRVDKDIYRRFKFLAKLAFRRSPPLSCQVNYVVTMDGKVKDVQLKKSSPNMLFNIIAVQTVKSVNGDVGLLAFPDGSKRLIVTRESAFNQNFDRERCLIAPCFDLPPPDYTPSVIKGARPPE